MRLKENWALITGGTSGIGLPTAQRYLSEVCRVAVTVHNPASPEEARRELGTECPVIPNDAGDVSSQRLLAQTVRKEFGRLDMLFINAGIAKLGPLQQGDEAAYDRSFTTNIKGPSS
jgi:NAD(P)-dependent dehydrogenase (short-subunit alcohol dehydrogenase family)